ncbi:Glutathione S-transferase, C-terminal domain containing protein [Novymonas esmeraldas]|uniref:Glutathione S-transferase, C-terminal domain containing protein n=1 Tax=Novymonas esmeraldas TaxID=1808958 RepID=A0AAW0EQ37_9TRYP
MTLGHLISGAQNAVKSAVGTVREHVFPWSRRAPEPPPPPPSRWGPVQLRVAIGAAAVAGAIATVATASHVSTLLERRRRRRLIHLCEDRETELFLFILPRAPWAPSLSPSCTRVEAVLRANGIPYKAIETIDPYGAPHGELPFLIYKRQRVDQLPRMMDFIAGEFDLTMDDALTRDQRAVGAALRRTVEYSMERFLYRVAFIDHPSLALTQLVRALHISRLHARLAVRGYANKLRQRLALTSYGALVREQYENEFLQDCEALEAQIAHKRYLFSDTTMTSYDCAVFSLLVPFAYMGRHTTLSPAYAAVSESAVLMAYVTRISRRLFSDLNTTFDAVGTSSDAHDVSDEEKEKLRDGGGDGVADAAGHAASTPPASPPPAPAVGSPGAVGRTTPAKRPLAAK